MKTDKPIRALAVEFLSFQDVRVTTRDMYLRNLDLFFRWLVTNRVDYKNIRRPNLIAYKQSLLKRQLAASTVDAYLNPVKMFFKWLEENNIHDNVAIGIHLTKRYRGYNKDWLRVDQVQKLLKSFNKKTLSDLRDFAMVNLMLYLGLRRCEIHRLNVGDIDFWDNEYSTLKVMRKGQTEKQIIGGLGLSVTDPLLVYLEKRFLSRNFFNHKDKPLFVSISRNSKFKRLHIDSISHTVKNKLKEIDIDNKKITCHSLRHSFAINALLAGATIFDVQNALGHVSAETTKIYLSAIEQQTLLTNPAVRSVEKVFN